MLEAHTQAAAHGVRFVVVAAPGGLLRRAITVAGVDQVVTVVATRIAPPRLPWPPNPTPAAGAFHRAVEPRPNG